MAESDRRMKLKGLCLILRNFGRGSACLLKKYLILSEKSGFFFGKFSEGFIRNLPACCESCYESDGYLFTGILINDGVVKGFIISIGDFINDSGMMRIFQSVISLQILIQSWKSGKILRIRLCTAIASEEFFFGS